MDNTIVKREEAISKREKARYQMQVGAVVKMYLEKGMTPKEIYEKKSTSPLWNLDESQIRDLIKKVDSFTPEQIEKLKAADKING